MSILSPPASHLPSWVLFLPFLSCFILRALTSCHSGDRAMLSPSSGSSLTCPVHIGGCLAHCNLKIDWGFRCSSLTYSDSLISSSRTEMCFHAVTSQVPKEIFGPKRSTQRPKFNPLPYCVLCNASPSKWISFCPPSVGVGPWSR